MAYPTLDELKGFIGVEGTASDFPLQSLLDAAIAYVEEYTASHFSGTPATATEKYYYADVFRDYPYLAIRPRHHNVATIVSVQIGSDTVDSADTLLKNMPGSILFKGSIEPDSVITVEYTYGPTDTPADVAQAIKSYAVISLKQSGIPGTEALRLASERSSNYQASFAVTNAGRALRLVHDILDRHRELV